MTSYGEKNAVVGFGEAVGVAECVNDAVEVEGVWLVSAETKAVQKAESFIDVVVSGAESVNLFGPV